MGDAKNATDESETHIQSCGWLIKHAPHSGFDIAGDLVLICPGAFEQVGTYRPNRRR